jgi:hypothetical protein
VPTKFSENPPIGSKAISGGQRQTGGFNKPILIFGKWAKNYIIYG